MKKISIAILLFLAVLAACAPAPTLTPAVVVPTAAPQANLPNPASAFCAQQGYKLEIRSAADGSQAGVCVFPDGSECDEWAYFRGTCVPAGQAAPTSNPPETPAAPAGSPAAPTEIPTQVPIKPEDYQGFWTYTHAVYKFSIMMPEDWTVDETTTSDPLMNGHALRLHPTHDSQESIRLTFRRVGENVPLWPTGVGSGEFLPQGTLDVAGQPARRILFVCPTGGITSIWYHDGPEDQPNIRRGGLEFGFIFSYGTCEAGSTSNLGGKVQRVGEMIIASLKAP